MANGDKDKKRYLLQLISDAQSFIHHGKKEEALNCYDKILQRFPNERSALYGKGMAYYEFGELKEALKYFNLVLSQNSNDIDSLYTKGIILNKIIKHQEAIELYDKIIALEPKLGYVWLAKGFALINLNKIELALDCFNNAEKFGTKNDVLIGKGHAYRKLHNYKEAKSFYQAAISIDPYDSEALFGLGAIEFENNNLKNAQEYLYKSVVQDEDNLDAWKILAEIYKATKQKENEKVAKEKINELEI